MTPKIGIICGSGLNDIGEAIIDPVSICYSEIPGFHLSTVPGHKNKLLFGRFPLSNASSTLVGPEVVCMQGRFHGYEGIPYSQCSFPIRVMKLLGVEKLIITNAAGSVNPDYNLGEFIILKDHLPLAISRGLDGPLIGPNDEEFGPRFFSTNNAYDRELILKFQNLSNFKTGVYAMLPGPNFESTAELKMLNILGADLVGMSTCNEVVVAAHCGIKCLGISLVTNKCPLSYEVEVDANHEEVCDVGGERVGEVVRVLSEFLGIL